MTTDRDFTRIADAWLADGPEELSDRVLDAVVDEIHVTRQRHGLRLPRRFESMTALARVAAAAAIGVLAIGGALYAFAPGGSGPGGPGPTPSPTASPTRSASPIALVQGPLPAGTYVTKPFDDADGIDDGDLGLCTSQDPDCLEDPADDTIRISFTVPEGWERAPQHSIWLAAEKQGPPGGASLIFERGASLYAEPCGDAPPPNIPVGPTVDDFANVGKSMTLQVPDDISACTNSYWPWEPGFYAQGPGQRWHLWILDVDGVRVVIRATDFAATSTQHQAEIQAIVDSIQIQP